MALRGRLPVESGTRGAGIPLNEPKRPSTEILPQRRREGQEDISIGGVLHGPGQDADYRIGPSVEFYLATCHVRVGAEVLLPEGVSEDGDVIFSGLGLCGRKSAPDEAL